MITEAIFAGPMAEAIFDGAIALVALCFFGLAGLACWSERGKSEEGLTPHRDRQPACNSAPGERMPAASLTADRTVSDPAPSRDGLAEEEQRPAAPLAA